MYIEYCKIDKGKNINKVTQNNVLQIFFIFIFWGKLLTLHMSKTKIQVFPKLCIQYSPHNETFFYNLLAKITT